MNKYLRFMGFQSRYQNKWLCVCWMSLLGGMGSTHSAEFSGGRNEHAVYERILMPLLVDLDVRYEKSKLPQERAALESSAHRCLWVYWVHVYKFGEKPSAAIENALSGLIVTLFESESFIDLVRNRAMYWSKEGEFIGMHMKAGPFGSGEIKIGKGETGQYKELVEEFIGFMTRLRDARVKDMEDLDGEIEYLRKNELKSE